MLVGRDQDDPDVWRRAVEIGAEYVLRLPDSELARRSDRQRRRRSGSPRVHRRRDGRPGRLRRINVGLRPCRECGEVR